MEDVMARQSRGTPDRPVYVAMIGPGDPRDSGRSSGIVPGDMDAAEEVGRLLAAHGAVLVCGGLGGVMKAACMGAHNNKPVGITVGFLPGDKHGDGNDYLSIEIPTGLGELRNALVVGAAEAVIVVGGSWGTMNEVSLAMKCWAVRAASALTMPHAPTQYSTSSRHSGKARPARVHARMGTSRRAAPNAGLSGAFNIAASSKAPNFIFGREFDGTPSRQWKWDEIT